MESQLNINWMHSACFSQALLHVTPKIGYVDPSVTPLSTTWRYRRLSSKNQTQNSPPKIHGDFKHIPVEYKLDAFSMLSTGTTSRHPKNWLCRSERNSALDNMEISQTLLQKSDTKLHGDFKHIPHTSSNTLPSQHPAKPFRLQN